MGMLSLTEEEELELAVLLEQYNKLLEEDVRKEQGQLYKYLFPENDIPLIEGRFPSSHKMFAGESKIHRRDNYPKHQEFWKKGATYNQRLFRAGNRCITPWTFIETVNGSRPSREVLFQPNQYVQSWGGESECVRSISGGFLKAFEPAYRFVMEDYSFFDCTANHQLLSESGWISADQLVLQSSGLCSTHTIEDYQANCEMYGYLYDQQLPLQSNNAQEPLPSQVDVRQRSLIFSQAGVMERIHQYIPFLLVGEEPQGHSGLSLLLALFEQFSAACLLQPVVPLSHSTQEFRKSLFESFLAQSAEQCNFDHTLSSLHDSQETISIYYPFSHLPLVGGKRIFSIVPLGYQPIIDATVEDTHNYKAGGVFHHNTGKTVAGCLEVVFHVTGLYPLWWKGKRFTTCNEWWVVGVSQKQVLDVLQPYFMGKVGDFGSGLIPRDHIDFDSLKDAKKVDTAVERVRIRHVNGTYSTIVFKSYEQSRDTFQGDAVSIFLDEEPPQPIYAECLMRTMTGGNILIMTFTPLKGVSEVITSWFPDGDVTATGEVGPGKWVTSAGMDDVKHLDEEKIEQILSSFPPFQRTARRYGLPTLEAGAIYPVEESLYVIEPFEVPKHWARCYGMDVGRHTSAVWIACDREAQMLYVYSEYYNAADSSLPSTHAEAIKSRGKWITGAIDTAAHSRSATDGDDLFSRYTELGLKIVNADKAVESGIFEVLELLSQGRLKIFNTCTQLLKEIRGYHRDEKGRIVKKNDHTVDALRYGVYTRNRTLKTQAEVEATEDNTPVLNPYAYNSPDSWMVD